MASNDTRKRRAADAPQPLFFVIKRKGTAAITPQEFEKALKAAKNLPRVLPSAAKHAK